MTDRPDGTPGPTQRAAPYAAVYCLIIGALTILWGLLVLLAIRDGEYDGILNAWWAFPYIAGIGLTWVLGLCSLIRREELRSWTILCMTAVLLSFIGAFLLSK